VTAAVKKAARWLAETPDDKRPHPLVPHLQSEFGLSAADAVAAIRESRLILARAS